MKKRFWEKRSKLEWMTLIIYYKKMNKKVKKNLLRKKRQLKIFCKKNIILKPLIKKEINIINEILNFKL